MRRAWVTVIGGLLAGALFGLTSLAVIEAARDVSGKITAAGSWVACFTMSAANVPLTVSLDGGPSVPALGVTWDGTVAHLSLTQQSPAPLAPGLHSWIVSDGTIATTLTYEVIDEAVRPPSNPRWFSTAIITRVPMSLPTTNLTLRIDASDNDHLFSNFPGTIAATDGQSVKEWQTDTDASGVSSFQQPTSIAQAPTWKGTKLGALMFLTAMQFDGVDDVINTWDKATGTTRKSASLFITDSAFTLAGIFHADSINNTDAVALENNDFVFGVSGLYAGVALADVSGVKKIRAVVYDGAYKYAEQTILSDHTYIFVMRFTGGQIKLTVIDDHGIETTSADVASGNIDAGWTSSMHPLNVGRANDTANGIFAGKIGELVAYNADVSGSDLTDLKAYFTAKWLPVLGTYYKTITVDHTQVNSNLTDFPLAIASGWYTPYSQPADPDFRTVQYGGYVRSDNGYDFRVHTDATRATPRDYQLVNYEPSTGAIEIYTRLNVSSTVDVSSCLSFGDPTLVTDGSTTGVWDANFKAVYHAGSATAISASDATANANHGTNHNAQPSRSFSGGEFALTNDGGVGPDQWVETVLFPQTAQTWEAWIWVSVFDGETGARHILNQSDAAGDHEIAIWLDALDVVSSDVGKFTWSGYSTGYEWRLKSTLRTASIYYHVVGTFDGVTARLYVNGSEDDSSAQGGPVGGSPNVMAIGAPKFKIDGGFHTNRFHGSVEEVRISNVERSADWITATYKNSKQLPTFISFGATTPAPAPAAVPAAIIFRNVNYE